jgi:hypothetical protein
MNRGISTSTKNNDVSTSDWNWLFRIGGYAGLIMFVLIPIQIVIFIAWPPPQTVPDYFLLFQHNRLLGMLDLDLLLIVDNLISIPLYLALYISLRRKNEPMVLMATLLGFLSIILYLVSREATLSMMTLSDQYAAATSEAQRQISLAAGQVLLTSYNGLVFNISYILGALALIMLSAIMLQTNLFSKATAYLGLAANIIAFGLFVPTVGVYISIFSVVFLWIWDLLVALRLFRLSNATLMKQYAPI